MGRQQENEPSVAELEERFNLLRGDESPIGIQERANLRMRLRKLTHEQIHPHEKEWVRVDVPRQADRSFYKINDDVYFGSVEVPPCVAQTLLYMIQANKQMEIDRMRENGREVILGSIADRAQTILRDT